MDFNENLKEARKSCGLTQQEVADILGIDKSTYSGYETGKREPDVKKIKALSSILSVTPDFLLGTESYYNRNENAFENDTLEVATVYANSDIKTRNKVRFLLDMPLLKEESERKKDLKTS